MKSLKDSELIRMMTFDKYLNRISGISSGGNQLRVSVKKSFQSASFSLFWRNWNPLFGYYLSLNINRPIKKISNSTISSFVTFLFSGFVLHDVWIMPLFYMIFHKVVWFPVTLIFLCYCFLIVFERFVNIRRRISGKGAQVIINTLYIIGGSIAGGLISALLLLKQMNEGPSQDC